MGQGFSLRKVTQGGRSPLLGTVLAVTFTLAQTRGQRGRITAAQPAAAGVGTEILKTGGNAVDVAVGLGCRHPRHRCWFSHFAPTLRSTALASSGDACHSGGSTGICRHLLLSAVGANAPICSSAGCHRCAHFPQVWSSSPLGPPHSAARVGKNFGGDRL